MENIKNKTNEEKNITPRFKLLVVDDSEYERELFHVLLESDYDIIEASDGREALARIVEQGDDIALVLLDMVMPNMDGLETLEKLKEMGWTERLPIFMVTSETNDQLVKRAYQLGASDYINKNLKRTIMCQRINNYIKLFARHKSILKQMEEENIRIKMIDSLTGACSSEGFHKKAYNLITENKDSRFSITVIDIRGFKYINELYGVDRANDLLKEFARLTKETLNENEVIGRIGADQFAVITYEKDYLGLQRVDNILAKLQHYFDEPGENFNVEFCMGSYVVMPEDSDNPDIDKFISFAIIAKDVAKTNSGRKHQYFNEEQWKKRFRAISIANHLEDAIANGEVEIWFQPQYSFDNKRIIGAEALCRWDHAQLGWLSPAEFIPILEENGMIFTLDKFVWEKTCSMLNEWKHSGIVPDEFHLSINISRADLHQDIRPDEYMERLIHKYGLKPKEIHVEITESAYIDDSNYVVDMVEGFHQKGFMVEIDDFGTGYSSLNSLQYIEADVVKLDMKFVHSAEKTKRGAEVMKGVVYLANTLGTELIAEGIETLEQAKFVSCMGCDNMQGYYFSKPVNSKKFLELLRLK